MTILRAATLAMTFVLVALAGTPARAQAGQMARVVQSAAKDAIIPADAAPILPALYRFETLAAAIAAQDLVEADEATRCLAGAIYFEAKGEPIDGQLAVAEVVINRARSGRFPADMCGVVKQPRQFSFVRDGVIPAVDTSRAYYRTALAVAKVALVKAWESSAPRALYFHPRRVSASPRWVRIAAIGNHVFYR